MTTWATQLLADVLLFLAVGMVGVAGLVLFGSWVFLSTWTAVVWMGKRYESWQL